MIPSTGLKRSPDDHQIAGPRGRAPGRQWRLASGDVPFPDLRRVPPRRSSDLHQLPVKVLISAAFESTDMIWLAEFSDFNDSGILVNAFSVIHWLTNEKGVPCGTPDLH